MTPQSAFLLAQWVAEVHPAVLMAFVAQQQKTHGLGFFGQSDDEDDLSGASDVDLTAGGALDVNAALSPDFDTQSVLLPEDTSSDFALPSAQSLREGTATATSADFGLDTASPEDIREGTALGQPVAASSAISSAPAEITPDISETVDVAAGDVSAPTVSAPSVSTPGVTVTLGQSLANGVAAAANYLLSPNGVNSMAAVAQSYFANQAAQENAQTAQNILNSQLLRAGAGLSPAPISYVQGEGPVLQGEGGSATPVTGSILSKLTPASGLTTVLVIGGVLVVAGLFIAHHEAASGGAHSKPSTRHH